MHATTQHTAIPAIGLGTFRLQGQVVIDSVTTGLAVGYRHIDTAQTDMAQMATQERGERLANPDGLAPQWD